MGTKQRQGNRAKKRAAKAKLEAELAKFQETATKDARVTAAPSSELFVLDKAGSQPLTQSRAKGIQPLEKDPEFKHTSRYETEFVEAIVKGDRKTKGVKRKRAQRSTIQGDAGANATAPATRITHAAYDLWGVAPDSKTFAQNVTSTVATLSEEHKEEILPMARNAALRQKALQEGGKAALPTDMPAVPLPSAGSSYHPEASAHQDLLGEETAKEIHLQRQEEKTATVLLPDEAMRKQLGLDVYGQRMVSEPNYDSDNFDGGDFLVSHDVGDGSGSDEEGGAGGPAASGAGGDVRLVTAKALTRKDRARRARHEEAEAAAAAARHEKKMLRAIDHLDTVKGLVEYQAKQKAKRAAQRKARRAAAKAEARANPPRLLGHKPMPDTDLPLQVPLSHQLGGSLRGMKATTASVNAVKERFANLHRRKLVSMDPPPKKQRKMVKILKNK